MITLLRSAQRRMRASSRNRWSCSRVAGVERRDHSRHRDLFGRRRGKA